MGLGIGGQLFQRPSSKLSERSVLRRKKGTTSVVPALETVFFPQARSISDAAADAGESPAGALGWSRRERMVAISLWKWVSNGAWKESMMVRSLVASNAWGVGRVER